jgi:hypothetical protein
MDDFHTRALLSIAIGVGPDVWHPCTNGGPWLLKWQDNIGVPCGTLPAGGDPTCTIAALEEPKTTPALEEPKTTPALEEPKTTPALEDPDPKITQPEDTRCNWVCNNASSLSEICQCKKCCSDITVKSPICELNDSLFKVYTCPK